MTSEILIERLTYLQSLPGLDAIELSCTGMADKPCGELHLIFGCSDPLLIDFLINDIIFMTDDGWERDCWFYQQATGYTPLTQRDLIELSNARDYGFIRWPEGLKDHVITDWNMNRE